MTNYLKLQLEFCARSIRRHEFTAALDAISRALDALERLEEIFIFQPDDDRHVNVDVLPSSSSEPLTIIDWGFLDLLEDSESVDGIVES